MCYMVGIKVKHMPSDWRAGVHRENRDLVDSIAPYSDSILLIFVFLSCDKVIEMSIMLDIMFRLCAGTVGTNSGRVTTRLVVLCIITMFPHLLLKL